MLVVAMALELQIPPMYLVLLSFGFGAYVSFLPWKESTCSSPDVVHSYFYWEFINMVLCCCMGDILRSAFGVLNGLLLKFSFYNCFCPFFMGSTSTCSLISCPSVAGNFWSLPLLHYDIFFIFTWAEAVREQMEFLSLPGIVFPSCLLAPLRIVFWIVRERGLRDFTMVLPFSPCQGQWEERAG